MLSKLFPYFDYKEAKQRFRDTLLRKNKYRKFPPIINAILEKAWKSEMDDVWDQIYDSLIHSNIAYADKMESKVN